MAKKKEPENAAGRKAAVKEAEKAVAAAQVNVPLKVEVNFPSIFDLKQAIGLDNDGNLTMAIQFKVKVDQFETFRLINLLKQPHGLLYATIGTPQSAMDFKFTKEGKVEILKAQVAAEKPKMVPAGNGKSDVVFQEITFNHIPTDDRPFGVVIDFQDGTKRVEGAEDEVHVSAGRGKSPVDAIMDGLKHINESFAKFEKPNQFIHLVNMTKETPARIKILRALEVGSFPKDEDTKQ